MVSFDVLFTLRNDKLLLFVFFYYERILFMLVTVELPIYEKPQLVHCDKRKLYDVL